MESEQTVVMFLLFQDAVSMASTTSCAFVTLAMLEGPAMITMTAASFLVFMVLSYKFASTFCCSNLYYHQKVSSGV